MKILFAGPSLAQDLGAIAARHPGILLAGPVARGDILKATRSGAVAIGIVDGNFAERPPVWHKEILDALEQGVRIAGGASMGALRAAECAAFGMVGIGEVYRLIAEGIETDDACVAQVHAPADLGWAVVSEAAVTVDATLRALCRDGRLNADSFRALDRANRSMPFAERTLRRLADAVTEPGPERDGLRRLLTQNRVDIKRTDGLLVLDWLKAAPDDRGPRPQGWTTARSSHWHAFIGEVNAAAPET